MEQSSRIEEHLYLVWGPNNIGPTKALAHFGPYSEIRRAPDLLSENCERIIVLEGPEKFKLQQQFALQCAWSYH